jgi:hypothetical protein
MTNNVNAQQWLDEKYPKHGVCRRSNDPENKGKRREQIVRLEIQRGKVGNGFFRGVKKLVGSLKLEGFTNLQTLICSFHQLTSLDVSDCKNLENLDCIANDLALLDLSGCEKLFSVSCDINYLTNDTLILPKEGRIAFLNVRNNKLEGDLTFFSSLTDLEQL